MKIKKWFLFIAIIFVLGAYVFYSRHQDEVTTMEKMISKHIKTKEIVTIYNAINVDDYSLVSYIIEGKNRYEKVGYAMFILDSKGNYELLNIVEPDRVIEMADDITIYEFLNLKSQFPQVNRDDFSINPSVFIISNNPKLAKIGRKMENGEIEYNEVVASPSISFFYDLDEVNNIKYNFYDERGILLNKSEDIVVESPMTISNNELSSIDGQIHYLRLKMTKGRYYEDWNPGAYMGTIWEGKYILELVDEEGVIIDYIELNEFFEASTLIFTSSFKIEFDDYNDDGDLDFTIGQFATSSVREYMLFTIRKDGKLEKLPIKDHSSLYISNSTGYYSTKLTKLDNSTFKTEYYNNTERITIEEVFKWNGQEFIKFK